ncbi:hypothetical protein DFH28DRAFT_926434 [Melampsora americana]|nr:hypothetical protein DFH28DRAFT_926434 [Melampsora americana]
MPSYSYEVSFELELEDIQIQQVPQDDHKARAFDVLAIPYPHQSRLGTDPTISKSSMQPQKRSIFSVTFLGPQLYDALEESDREIEELERIQEKNVNPELLNNIGGISCRLGIDPQTGRCKIK